MTEVISDVVRPSELIVPDITTNGRTSTSLKVSGGLFFSGAALYYMSGAVLMQVVTVAN